MSDPTRYVAEEGPGGWQVRREDGIVYAGATEDDARRRADALNAHPMDPTRSAPRGLRLALALILAGLALQVAAAVWYFSQAATVSVPADSLVTYAGIIRRGDAGGWHFVAESSASHVRAGFSSLRCDSATGILHVLFPMGTSGGLKNVASAWVQHDETMGRRGIIAGPSIGKGDMRILFTRITGDGPRPLSCASSYLRGDSANFWIGIVGQPYE